jgi:hypothetical protein
MSDLRPRLLGSGRVESVESSQVESSRGSRVESSPVESSQSSPSRVGVSKSAVQYVMYSMSCMYPRVKSTIILFIIIVQINNILPNTPGQASCVPIRTS